MSLERAAIGPDPEILWRYAGVGRCLAQHGSPRVRGISGTVGQRKIDIVADYRRVGNARFG